MSQRGHAIYRLVRTVHDVAHNCFFWDPAKNALFPKEAAFDAVVHLAGENIFGRRWTEQRKEALIESRVKSTSVLCRSLLRLKSPPEVFMCASGVGYYGSRGEEVLDEESGAGEGFLADLCREWEEAAYAAQENESRVVNLRLGTVLHPLGGALERMLPFFRWGLGGPLGSGEQYMSWAAIHDVCKIIEHCIVQPEINGPVNLVSPNPVTNAEFTAQLAKALHRPALLPAPGPVLRLVFGQAADELLLASTRVLPKKLMASGYIFIYPNLSEALGNMLAREKKHFP